MLVLNKHHLTLTAFCLSAVTHLSCKFRSGNMSVTPDHVTCKRSTIRGVRSLKLEPLLASWLRTELMSTKCETREVTGHSSHRSVAICLISLFLCRTLANIRLVEPETLWPTKKKTKKPSTPQDEQQQVFLSLKGTFKIPYSIVTQYLNVSYLMIFKDYCIQIYTYICITLHEIISII